MIKIFNFIKNNTTKIIASCIVASAMTSCDPTIDALSFDLPDEGSIEDLTGPTASFGFFQTDNEESNEVFVTFANSSVNGTIYDWDFGNGQTSIDREFTAAYDNPGSGTTASYLVTLTVTDNFDVSDTFMDTITIDGFFREGQLTDDFTLINTGEADDTVIIDSYSSQQVEEGNASRQHFASNLLDKDGGDFGTRTKWTTNDALAPTGTGDGLGDGEYVIIDLGAEYELGLIRFKTNGESAAYAYQIETSTAGTSTVDFTYLLPEDATTTTDWSFTDTSLGTDWQNKELTTPTTARYVKLTVFGRYSSIDPLVLSSAWNNWEEIEFFTSN